jgi:hypothetical protein
MQIAEPHGALLSGGNMLSAGQEVNTKYGVGVVVSAGSAKPHVFVRILANSKIYVLDGSDVIAAGPPQGDSGKAEMSHPVEEVGAQVISLGTHASSVPASENVHAGSLPTAGQLDDNPAAPSIPGGSTIVWRGQMKRGQTEGRRRAEDTPLSVFVGARLAALGMKQSEFCRLTGFDQGLLSKIQSSMISKLNLETALRLAVGLSVSPGRILALIGRKDLTDLITKAYPDKVVDMVGIDMDETLPPLREISQLVLRAHSQGRDLTPVIDLLEELVSTPIDQTHGHRVADAEKSDATTH